jgi:phosphatidylglycerophosphate synthase
MAILAYHLLHLPRRRGDLPEPLLKEAGLQLALFGVGLAGIVLMALATSTLGWWAAVTALLCYVGMAALILAGLIRHAHPHRFGLANTITLSRAALTALLFGIAAEWLAGGTGAFADRARWSLAAIAALILILDGLDGHAARRGGTASPFGARFDMEADALFVLALFLLVMATGALGPWVLACGVIRYAFLIACQIEPRLNGPLPPRRRRKAIYVVQAVSPMVALMPICPPIYGSMLCAAAFGFVAYSFGADCIFLLTRPQPLAV